MAMLRLCLVVAVFINVLIVVNAKDNALSDGAKVVLNDLKVKLSAAVSDKCKPLIEIAATLPKTNQDVMRMCQIVSKPESKLVFLPKCSEAEYDKIVQTVCDEFKETPTEMSRAAKVVLKDIKEKLVKVVSPECNPSIDTAESVIKTNDAVLTMCDSVSALKAKQMFFKTCSQEDYDKIVLLVCDEFKPKETGNSLSEKAQLILDEVKQKVNKSVSDHCKPSVTVAASLAKTDKKVLGMCDEAKGPQLKKVFLANCSQDEYDKIVKIICDEIKEKGKGTGSQLSKEASAIVLIVATFVYTYL